jgi:hypothetical protein
MKLPEEEEKAIEEQSLYQKSAINVGAGDIGMVLGADEVKLIQRRRRKRI